MSFPQPRVTFHHITSQLLNLPEKIMHILYVFNVFFLDRVGPPVKASSLLYFQLPL